MTILGCLVFMPINTLIAHLLAWVCWILSILYQPMYLGPCWSSHISIWSVVTVFFDSNAAVLAIGGIGQAGHESSVEVLGPDRQAWTPGPQLPFKISGAAAVHGPQGEVILIGGTTFMSGFSTVILWPPNSTRFFFSVEISNLSV